MVIFLLLKSKALKNGLLYASLIILFFIQKNKNLNLYALNDDSSSNFEQQLTDELSSEINSNLNSNSNEDSNENKENSDEEITSYDIYNLLSEESKKIFISADAKKLKEISKELKSIYEYIIKNYSVSEYDYDIADMAVISLLLKNGIIDSDKNYAAQRLEEAIETYKSYEKNKYEQEKYDSMQKSSEIFGNKYKKSASCNPENIISLSEDKKLNNYPIIYNENILISLNDATNLAGINPEIEYMDNNATIVLRFDDQILEIEQGGNKAQLNDIQTIMENPVLNIDGVTYVPASILNLLGRKIISNNNAVIIY